MGAAINVGEIYAYLIRDLKADAYNTPDFEHALHNARLIEAVKRADELGERQKLLEQVEGLDEDVRVGACTNANTGLRKC